MVIEFVWVPMVYNFHQNLADLFNNILVCMRIGHNQHFKDKHASKNYRGICISEGLQSKSLDVLNILGIDLMKVVKDEKCLFPKDRGFRFGEFKDHGEESVNVIGNSKIPDHCESYHCNEYVIRL